MSQKKQRVYVAVMIVGAIALAVDRVVLSGASGVAPIPTSKSHESEPGVTTMTAGSAVATALEPPAYLPIPEVPFPRGLKEQASALPVRDLFARVPAPGGGATPDKRERAAVSSGRAPPFSSAVFVARRRLNAVVMSQRLRIAVVDGTWVRLGQLMDGCELRSVSGNEARFVCADGEAVLTVDAPRVLTPG